MTGAAEISPRNGKLRPKVRQRILDICKMPFVIRKKVNESWSKMAILTVVEPISMPRRCQGCLFFSSDIVRNLLLVCVSTYLLYVHKKIKLHYTTKCQKKQFPIFFCIANK